MTTKGNGKGNEKCTKDFLCSYNKRKNHLVVTESIPLGMVNYSEHIF